MIELDQGEIATILAGTLVPSGADASGTDARIALGTFCTGGDTVVPGAVYFALPEAADAAAEAREAAAAGAALVVTGRDLGLPVPQVIV
ncbi:MAG: UDP-N-acetylmuramoylalanyl-D-glutamate--2,6-diaminopimelate ligase, partial [Rhodoglobus sp.]